MPETDIRDDKNFFVDVPPPDHGFFLKGSAGYDWGMKNRLARIFRPDTGRTVMLAIDHGYFQGPTTGLERVDITVVPIVPLRGRPHADAGHAAIDHPGRSPRWPCNSRQWRAEYLEGTFQRTPRR